MITVIEKAVSRLHTEVVLEKAARILRDGGLVAFPTETVYGLGANAYNPAAAIKTYEAKGRPSDNPLIVHINSIEMLFDVCGQVSGLAKILAETFWPGPLTLIMPKSDKIPLEVTGGLNTVAVRFPQHKTALSLIEKCGFPLSAPSANSSGKPSPTRASHVVYDLSGKIDMIIDSGPCEIGIESTIVDITDNIPIILRPGAISQEQIRKVVSRAIVKINEEKYEKPVMAPGTKYKHYSPKADVTVVLGDPHEVAERINELIAQAEKNGKKAGVLTTDETKHLYGNGHVISLGSVDSMETVAQNLFKALRKFDFYEVDSVFSEGFSDEGIGLAIMNRLLKAANDKVIHV